MQGMWRMPQVPLQQHAHTCTACAMRTAGRTFLWLYGPDVGEARLAVAHAPPWNKCRCMPRQQVLQHAALPACPPACAVRTLAVALMQDGHALARGQAGAAVGAVVGAADGLEPPVAAALAACTPWPTPSAACRAGQQASRNARSWRKQTQQHEKTGKRDVVARGGGPRLSSDRRTDPCGQTKRWRSRMGEGSHARAHQGQLLQAEACKRCDAKDAATPAHLLRPLGWRTPGWSRGGPRWHGRPRPSHCTDAAAVAASVQRA